MKQCVLNCVYGLSPRSEINDAICSVAQRYDSMTSMLAIWLAELDIYRQTSIWQCDRPCRPLCTAAHAAGRSRRAVWYRLQRASSPASNTGEKGEREISNDEFISITMRLS